MLLVNDGLRALARHPLLVLLMMLALLVLSAAINLPLGYAIQQVDLKQLPLWFRLLNIASTLALSAGLAALYAVTFALLGRAIDMPLWKCSGIPEALRRFFVPWFILTFTAMTLRSIQSTTTSAELYFLLETLLFFGGLFIVPVGACIMHHGALVWEELGEALAPIGKQFGLVIPVLMVGLLQSVVQEIVYIGMPGGETESVRRALIITLSNPFMGVFDLLAFAMMWRVCMHHRDTAHEHADLDD